MDCIQRDVSFVEFVSLTTTGTHLAKTRHVRRRTARNTGAKERRDEMGSRPV